VNRAVDTIRIGAGAGFAGDRIEPAIELIEHGALDFLVFECLAERTIAIAQQARRQDPQGGYDALLMERMRRVLPGARERGVRIVTNAGAANPLGAAHALARLASEMGLAPLRIAAVLGDDVRAAIEGASLPLFDRPGTTADLTRILSANAYLGGEPIARALGQGADVVITGRVGDPALFTGPLAHAFGWSFDDPHRIGRATLIGHLLECAGQLSGGYFADGDRKQVPDLARLGFPLAEVARDGSAVLTKVAGSGGAMSIAACKEQLLYEILDPAAYQQADVIADFSQVRFEAIGPDRIHIDGGTGRPASGQLKVSIGYDDGFIGEGQISYAGPGAARRACMALDIVKERLTLTDTAVSELREELIGIDSVDFTAAARGEPREVRARLAGRAEHAAAAAAIGAEVEALYTNGPAGGGGATRSVRPVVAVASALIPASLVTPRVEMVDVRP
jgi:hypothetical protein